MVCAFSVGAQPPLCEAEALLYDRQLLQYLNRLEAMLPKGVAARRDIALALMAQCVGGLMLARAVKDEQLSGRILKACRQAALKLGAD